RWCGRGGSGVVVGCRGQRRWCGGGGVVSARLVVAWDDDEGGVGNGCNGGVGGVNKVQQMGGARGRAYAIDDGIRHHLTHRHHFISDPPPSSPDHPHLVTTTPTHHTTNSTPPPLLYNTIKECVGSGYSTEKGPFGFLAPAQARDVFGLREAVRERLDLGYNRLSVFVSGYRVRLDLPLTARGRLTEFEKFKSFNDRTVDYDKHERKLNETLGLLAHKDIDIKEGLKLKAYEISIVKEKHDELVKQSLLTKSHYESLVKQKTKVITDLKLMEEKDIDKMLSMEKQLKFLNEIVYKRNQSIQTIHMMEPKVPTYNGRPTFANLRYLKQAQSKIPCLYAFPYDQSTHVNRLIPNGEETLALERESRSKLNKDFVRVNHKTNVSRPQHRSNQMKDKVVPNNSQVKLKKTQVEDHPRIPSISNKIKSVTACNDGLNSRTSNINVVCATCEKCLVDSDHFACVTKMLNDVNARTKKPNIIQLILFIVDSGCTKHMTGNLKLLCNFVEKYLGTVRFGNDQFAPILGNVGLVQGNIMINRDLQGNDLLTGNRGFDLNTISLQESTSSTLLCLMAKALPAQAWLWHRRLSHLNFDYINLLSKKDVVISLPKLKYIKNQLCSSCEVSKAKRSSFKSKAVPSLKGRLNLLHMNLCGPMRVASINGKKYILVIMDDYSRYNWTLFLRSKDETPETLHAFFKEEGIKDRTSIARTPEQNGVAERQNHTLVEAA
nr:hypothetical protein [Tanacetum cinerariifolium]